MGNGWHEWPLVLFTVLGQCAAGAVIVTGLGWYSVQHDAVARQRLVRSQNFLWLMMAIGFLASVMHLGSPMRAFNSLNQIGHSALSNEIASGSLFFAVGGFWWLLSIVGKMPAALEKLWLAISMVLGIIFVWSMTRVYQIETVPTWYNGYTTASFFLTMVLTGPLFAAWLMRRATIPFNGITFATLSALALLGSLAIVILQGMDLFQIHSSVQQAATLVPGFGVLQVCRLILLTLGLGYWICPMLLGKTPHPMVLMVGLLLVLAGELIGRVIFYGLHMTVGMAVAG